MIYVIGGTNIDQITRIDSKARLYESNPGRVYKRFGGVGRNISESISNYKELEFITAVPDRIEYHEILKDLNKKNVSTKYSKFTSPTTSSIYMNILDNDGLVLGIADMSSIDELKVEDIKELKDIIKDDDIVEIDANFDKEIVSYVLDNFKGIKMLDAVSSKKLERLKDVLDKFDIIKLNNYEYEFIKYLNLKNTMITYGDRIVLTYKNKTYEVSHNKLKAVNPTGCGDTLFGAFIANFDKGIKEALEIGIIAAAACSQIDDNVPSLEGINKINESELDIKWKD